MKKDFQITVYRRLEKTVDDITLKFNPNTRKKDWVFYRDRNFKIPFFRIYWHQSKPKGEVIFFNCFKYRIKK